MNDKQFNQIMSRLEMITDYLLLNMINDEEFKNKVIKLAEMGLSESQIIKLLKSNRDKVHSILRRVK